MVRLVGLTGNGRVATCKGVLRGTEAAKGVPPRRPRKKTKEPPPQSAPADGQLALTRDEDLGKTDLEQERPSG